MNIHQSEKEIFEILMSDQKIRREVCRQSHYWFFHVYFNQYVKYRTAKFQKEIFKITEKDNWKMSVIVAFRGSAKSTIISMSYPIWAMLGRQSKKFEVIIGQTQHQSRLMLRNIKSELETNELLIRDFGPFENSSDWRSNTLVMPKYDTRITALSTGESIRGLRHRQYRPDLIICDDIEDISTVKFRENRDKNYNWLLGEVIPIGDTETKIIIIGNLLHEDSLMMRLKDHIEYIGDMRGTYNEYPLMSDDDICLWPDKFPTLGDIKELRLKVPDRVTYEREYLLHIVADGNQVINRNWIKYYDPEDIPKVAQCRMLAVGIDLAISEKTTADFTAMVPALVYGYGDELKVYILSNIINKRLNFIDTIQKIKELQEQIRRPGNIAKFFSEAVAYQTSLVQALSVENILIEGVNIGNSDKRSRLCVTSPYIESGKIIFPKYGAEILIDQIVNFGVEKYDDLADAFSLVINKIIETDQAFTRPKEEEKINEVKLVYNKFIGEWINPSKPITAGIWDMKF